MADKACVAGIGAAKVIGIGMTCFALPHLHGVLAVAGDPVLAEHGRLFAGSHVEMARGAKLPLGELMTVVTGCQRVHGMAEEHVVRLLLVDFPVHFLALLDVFVEEDPFGLAFAEHLRMADSTVLCRGQGVERPVRTEMVTDRAVQRSILEMRLMAELHGLILSAEQKFRENPPAKHERNDKTDDERCGTEFKSFCQTAGLLVGRRVVLPILHTLRLLKWLCC